MGLPSVLIFTPIYEEKDYCLDEFVKYAKEIDYPNKRHIFIDNSKTDDYYKKLKKKLEPQGFEVYRVTRGNNTREALARAQNFARNMATKEDYSYMFSLESDIMVPKQILSKLIVSGKNVISALYFIGNDKVRLPCITFPEWNETLGAFGTRLIKQEEVKDYVGKGIKQVQAAGFGTTLIYKTVFRKFPFTYDPRFQGHSDIYFFNQMFMNNIPVFVDTNILCDHQNSNWEDVKDR